MADIKKIAVIGAGVMGHGIAQLALMGGYNVVLIDIKQEFVDNGAAKLQEALKKVESKGQLGEGKTTDALMKNLTKSINLAAGVKDVDFIIEAVVEDMKIKQGVYKTCDENAPKHCIIATNTSTMSISEIASATKRPDKCCGMHFFNPPALMRLIEIIACNKTSEATMDTAVSVGEGLACLKGKRYVPKVLKDRPGFIVNRLNSPVQIYMSTIFDKAADKKIPWEQIDADPEGKMPMGPCELCDYVGLDTYVHTMNYYAKTLSPDYKPGKVLEKMVAEKKLGAKTGQGFYTWPKGGRPKIDKSKKAGLFDLNVTFAIMLNEGCRLLEEGVVTGFKTIDDANMAGMNVPGPFGAGKKNYAAWCDLLNKLADDTKKNYFRPCEMMKSGKFVEMKK